MILPGTPAPCRGFFFQNVRKRMQDCANAGFIRCMDKAMIHRFLIFLSMAAALAGCSKMEGAPDRASFEDPYDYENGTVIREDLMAVATLRSQGGTRYLRLDPVSVGYILNPEDVKDIPDATRVYVQYKEVVSARPDFCTESVWVDWAMPLDLGEISPVLWSEAGSFVEHPVDIVLDWITSLEDGFLTLHYMVPSSGDRKHRFVLYGSLEKYHYYLVHDANGDTGGSLTDGIICFPVENLLPDTGGEKVTLSLTYIDLKNTQKTLTVDYRTPK